ncbi:hypothetical protein LXM50_14520 [Microbacterium sp. Au-Mic1]|uniref:hypothetical protein n=1 Tax=Microbacterium sp. Au-Mic1 TaxID=2906457 RepID=UPI001E30D7E1|nr:hypothetical protein [Microbacterium sp. Au-Mic1]MCE4027191.1 hypothetical protein [Microbacterium sp. Au-Mic1]
MGLREAAETRRALRVDIAAVESYERRLARSRSGQIQEAEIDSFVELSPSQLGLLFDRHEQRRQQWQRSVRRARRGDPASRQVFAWFGVPALATIAAYGAALLLDNVWMPDAANTAPPASDPSSVSQAYDPGAWDLGGYDLAE